MYLEEKFGPGRVSIPSRPQSFDLTGLSGRVVEFSGWNRSACISLTTLFLLECQRLHRGAAWIVPGSAPETSLFFPPDFISAGIDCSSLPIIRAESVTDGFALSERLLRSGGFGLVILDLTADRKYRRHTLGRLHNIAQRHDGLVLCLTRNPPGHPSLDPMVFVHVQVEVQSKGKSLNTISALIQKDKTGSPGRCMEWTYESPPGLC